VLTAERTVHRTYLSNSWCGVLLLHDRMRENKILLAPDMANDSQHRRDSWVESSRVWHALSNCDIILPVWSTWRATVVKKKQEYIKE
jgi:hypothetical protein